jgi:hypothetical protein
VIARATALATLLLAAAAGSAAAAPARLPPGTRFRHACADHSCKAIIATDAAGKILAGATPNGWGPPDLQSAYHVDPGLGSGVTVAVVDAFGYAALEADLAVYRQTFGLPPCTVASGCLTIVNNDGDTSPLPPDDDDWIGETSLDVDMVSAICPLCHIVVVQTSAAGNAGLDLGQLAAVKLHVDAISDSWGGPEDADTLSDEGSFNNAGIGTFACSGDDGYDSFQPGISGPSYPSTSQYAIAVGGTHLAKVDTSINPRGWVETAWSNAGSSCSTSILKPAFQLPQAACGMRAASDISAVADPSTGLAVYCAQEGGWVVTGGTSAASPIVTSLFAAAGHADAVPQFVYNHPEVFLDVTMGANGNCGTNVCNAGTGWDGPTGLGTPDQSKLVGIGGVAGAGPAVDITFPTDGATVQDGFTIQAVPADGTLYVTIDVDGTRVQALNAAPYQLSAPQALADGPHTVTVTAFDLDHNSQSAMVSVTQGSAAPMTGDDDGGGGCSTSGRGSLGGLLLVGAAVARLRHRRRAR